MQKIRDVMNIKEATIRVSSRIFCLGGKIVCKDQLCVKHAKFFTNARKNIKPDRVFIIRYCQNFLGGKLEGLGGKLPPPAPPQ